MRECSLPSSWQGLTSNESPISRDILLLKAMVMRSRENIEKEIRKAAI